MTVGKHAFCETTKVFWHLEKATAIFENTLPPCLSLNKDRNCKP